MPGAGQDSGDKQDTSFLSEPSSTPGSKLHLLDTSATPSTLKSMVEAPDNSIGSANSTMTIATPSTEGDTSIGAERNEGNAETTPSQDPSPEKGGAVDEQDLDMDKQIGSGEDSKNLQRNFGRGRGRGRGFASRRFHHLENSPDMQGDYQSRQLGRKLFNRRSFGHESNTEQFGSMRRYSEESAHLSSLLQASLRNDGLLGRYPGDDPKNFNQKLFSPPFEQDDGYENLFKMTRIKAPLFDESIDRMVTEQGIMAVEITGGAKLYLTANGGIRLINETAQVIVALSPDGGASALIHPAGRVYQYGSRVEISAHSKTDNLLAKMWYKGISFAAENGALVYLLDDAGTRTVHDIFSDMSGDFTTPVFLERAETGATAMPECARILQSSQRWSDEIGLTENWEIGGTRVIRTPDDVVRIIRGQNKYQLRACGNGLASISTPYIHCTASYGKTGPETSHIFVRRGERRLHYDGSTFILRNGGHSAGFDYNNQFTVF